MSPFFRGSVRPARKHPRPWSLNPRLNPDIAKDGVAARAGNAAAAGAPTTILRASIYGVGANTEAITLPVHNGVYEYERRAGADTAAIIAEKEEDEAAIGVETPVVVNAFGATPAVAKTETETGKVEEVDDTEKIDNSSPLHAGSIGTAVTAGTSGLESEAIPEEEKAGDKEWPLTSDTIDNKAIPDAKPKVVDVEPFEAVVLENPREPTKEAVGDEVMATPPAPSNVGTTETGETATEVQARSVVAGNTVKPGESSEIAPSTPPTGTIMAAPLEVESADPMTAETIGGGAGSTTAESPPVEADEMKATPIQPSSALEAEPKGVEDGSMAVAGEAPAEEAFQPKKEEEEGPVMVEDVAPASEATVATEAPMIKSEVAMDRNLTPPPEAHGRIANSESGVEDDESAAEAQFVPDHRHTPPSSRKPSRGEEAAMEEPQQPLKSSGVKDLSVEASIANEEPLISDEQLDVSDEFRPDVKM